MSEKLITWSCNKCNGDLCKLTVNESDGQPSRCPYGLRPEKYNCYWEEIYEPKHETVEEWEKRTGELWKAIDCDYGKEDQSGLYLGDLQMGVSTALCEALEKWYIANHHGKPEKV